MRQKLKRSMLVLLPLCLSLGADLVFAQGEGKDITKVAMEAKTQINSVVELIKLAAYVAGVGFALAGVLQFKAHKDNPQQVPLSKPVVMIIVSACLLFLPAIMDIAGESLFKGGQKSYEGGGTP